MKEIIIISNHTYCSDDSRRRTDWDFFLRTKNGEKMFSLEVEGSQKMRCFICAMMTNEMRMEAKFLIVGQKFSLFDHHMVLMIISTDWWQKLLILFILWKVKMTRLFISRRENKNLGRWVFLESFFLPFIIVDMTESIRKGKRYHGGLASDHVTLYIVIAWKASFNFHFPSSLFSSLSSHIVSWRDFGNFPHEWRFDYPAGNLIISYSMTSHL